VSWKGINPAIGGLTTAIDAVLRRTPAADICSLEEATKLFVLSDYSGLAADVRYLTYSFAFTNIAASRAALDRFTTIRRARSLGQRRMAYKGLNDRRKLAALPDFIGAARRLASHVVTFAVSKQINTLFQEESGEADETLTRILARYKPSVREHLARVLHFFALSLAGLSSPGQDVDWITDIDNIAPEQVWLRDLTTLTANISGHYLNHNLGRLRVGTTRSDDGSGLLEDVCAVPDLFAGSIAEALTHQSMSPLDIPSRLVLPFNKTVRRKAVDVIIMLTRSGPGALTSSCICIEPEGTGFRVQSRRFHEGMSATLS
jgi:hypothetical protein